MRRLPIALLGCACFAQTLVNRNAPPGALGTCAGVAAGLDYVTGGDLNGFRPLAESAYLYRDVSLDPPADKSLIWKQNIASDVGVDNFRIRLLYPDYGHVEGYPTHIVDGSVQPRVPVVLGSYASDSDPGPYPVPPMPAIQYKMRPSDSLRPLRGASDTNWPVATADDHVIVVDRSECVLIEFYSFSWDPITGKANAAGAFIFDLLAGDTQRPTMITSSSVSGLPLWPMFVKPENVRAQNPVPIDHALVMTAFVYPSGNMWSKKSFIWPAQHHQYASGINGNAFTVKDFPFGGRVRLNPSVPTNKGLSAQGVSIINALKKYGAIISDGGGMFDLYASASKNWNNGLGYPYGDLVSLWNGSAYLNGTRFQENNYEIVTQPGADQTTYCDQMYATKTAEGGCTKVTGAGAVVPPWTDPKPAINSFTASQTTVTAGTPVTLTWNLSGMRNRLKFITPDVGYTTKENVIITPYKTTTYTLMVQTSGGRVTSTLTITVP